MKSSESKLDIPTEWTFKNLSVANNFDAHVREQLPFYDLASGAVAHVIRHYLTQDGLLYDIGASTGNMTRLVADSLKSRNVQTVSIEDSAEMADCFAGYGALEIADARTYDYKKNFDVAVLFLVLMFLPIDERATLIETLYDRMRIGGALIIVDKTEPASGYVGTVLRRLALAGKVATGTDANEIIKKELSLAGSQRPLRDNELPDNAYCFFRFGEFAGWIIEK